MNDPDMLLMERQKLLDTIQQLIEEEKRQERERIITILEKEYPAISTWRCWPALKGGS